MQHSDDARRLGGEALWRFSLALYTRPGVADAVIALQDRAGLDVNLALFGLWLGASQGHVLTADEMVDAKAAVAPIAAAALAPLRQLRRQLKAAADVDLQGLRRRVASLEIGAERRVQYRLAAHFSGASGVQEGDRLAAAQANLALIFGPEAASPEARVLSHALALLIRAAPNQD